MPLAADAAVAVPLTCALYTRVAAQNATRIRAQRHRLLAQVRHEQGRWQTLPDRYDDDGYSGSSLDRPALRRLLDDARAQRFQLVVIDDPTRLARSLEVVGHVVAALSEAGVAIFCREGGLDPFGLLLPLPRVEA